MAYLPGERPLFNPWEAKESIQVHDSLVNGSHFDVSCIRNSAGPGSAYVEWGLTGMKSKLIALVRGPRQQAITRPQFEVEVSFASFSKPSVEDVEISRMVAGYVKEAIEGSLNLDSHPSSSTMIQIKILEAVGDIHSLIAPAITAASVACREAGINMNDEVVCMCINADGEGNMTNYSGQMRPRGSASVAVAFKVRSRQVSFIDLLGRLPHAEGVDAVIHTAGTLVDSMCNRLGISQ